jgi:gephyrin
LDSVLKPGKFIRAIGSDIKQGDIILQKNKKINFTDLGILASVKIFKLNVYKMPKIAIFSTGDELVDMEKIENFDNSENKYFSGIVDTNRLILKKLLKNQFPDLEIIDYGIIEDDMEKLHGTFEKIITDKNDIVITSGGVSMGEKDLVKKILEQKGEIIFGRLNMKPGKPTTFGKYKNLTVCGLPGNPVSCIVCFYLLLNFMIEAFSNPNLDWPLFYPYKTVKAKLMHDVMLDIERPEYSRGVLFYEQIEKSEFYVKSTGNQQSSRIKSFEDFNCLIVLAKADEEKNIFKLKQGDLVECILIKEFNNVTSSVQIKLQENDLSEVKNNIKIHDEKNNTTKKYTVGTITISDRAFKGEYLQDKSTESLKNYFQKKNKLFEIKEQKVVPDQKENIIQAYDEYVDKNYNLIVTSGGTGLSPRDITPEVTKSYIDKEAYSISNFISIESMKFTKFACLSRPVVGIKNNSLIITLPGNPKAVEENLSIIEDILPHILNQVNNVKDSH